MQTNLEKHRQHMLQTGGATAYTTSKTVAIIGSTGFLGPHIVAALLRKDSESKIVCLNRSVDGAERTVAALERRDGRGFHNLSRLHFFVTDITKPSMGLEDADAQTLCVKIDELVFNAWSADWSLPLEKFEPLLRAVQSAIDFCASSVKLPRITFVSSICAIGEWPRKHPNQPNIPEDVPLDCANAMAHGYGESKCIAELRLAHACTVFGLHVAIVRVGQIGGPVSLSAMPVHIHWPVQGWIHSIIRASKKVGCWPTHVQPLDWIPVDALAEGISTITTSERSDSAMQVYNMVHPTPAPWNLLLATLRDRFGLTATEVSLPAWLDMFEPEQMKLHSFLRAAGSGREHDMVFETDNAVTVLPKLDTITMDQLEGWLEGWDLELHDTRARL